MTEAAVTARYDAKGPSELSVSPSARVTVSAKSADGQWIFGRLATGQKGWFPANRVAPHIVASIASPNSTPAGRAGAGAGAGAASKASPIITRATCPTCGKNLSGKVLNIKGNRFHKECFNCTSCRQSLQKLGGFLEHQGSFYCKQCYGEQHGPKCPACAKPVQTGLKALGAIFHPECFKCTSCGCDFGSRVPYKPHEGKPYCDDCYAEVFLDKCFKCGEIIRGELIEGMQNKFHPQCLRCDDCESPIAAGDVFHTAGDRVYCDACFRLAFLRVCKICRKDVNLTKGYVSAGPYFFHEECWKCERCDVALGLDPDKFRFWRDKLLCLDCYNAGDDELIKYFFPDEYEEMKDAEKMDPQDYGRDFLENCLSNLLDDGDFEGLPSDVQRHLLQKMLEDFTPEDFDNFKNLPRDEQDEILRRYLEPELEKIPAYANLSPEDKEKFLRDLIDKVRDFLNDLPTEDWDKLREDALRNAAGDPNDAAQDFLNKLADGLADLDDFDRLGNPAKAALLDDFLNDHPDHPSYEDFKKNHSPAEQRKIMGDYLEPKLQQSPAYNNLPQHEKDRLKDNLAGKALDHLDNLSPDEYNDLANMAAGDPDKAARDFLDRLAKGLADVDDFDRLGKPAKAALLDDFLNDHPDHPSYEDFKKNHSPAEQRKIMGDYLEPKLQQSPAYNNLPQREKDRLKDDLARKALAHLDNLSPDEYNDLANMAAGDPDKAAQDFLDRLAKGLADLDDFDRLNDDAKAALLDDFLRDHPDHPTYEDFKRNHTPQEQRKIMADYLEPKLQKSPAYNNLPQREKDRLKDGLAGKALDHLDNLSPDEYNNFANKALGDPDKDAQEFLDRLAKGLADLDDFDRLNDDAKAALLKDFFRDHPDHPAYENFKTLPPEKQRDIMARYLEPQLNKIPAYNNLPQHEKDRLKDDLARKAIAHLDGLTPDEYNRLADKANNRAGSDYGDDEIRAQATDFLERCMEDPHNWQNFEDLPLDQKELLLERFIEANFGSLDAFKRMSPQDQKRFLNELLRHNVEDLDKFKHMAPKEKDAFMKDFVAKTLGWLDYLSPEEYEAMCRRAMEKYKRFKKPFIPPSKPPSQRPAATGGPYTYEQLRHIDWLPPDVPYDRREMFLNDKEFEKMFTMTKMEFSTLRLWRQRKLKRDLGVF